MKNLKLNLGLFVAVLSFLLTSCNVEDSADVNQERIYADYEVFYNSNTDKTWVVARFRFGGATGTLLQLNDPAFVEFNGEDLPFNSLFAGHYKEYAGQLTSGTFVYTDVDGNTYENSIPAYEPIEFPTGLDTLSKSNSYDLVWQGTELKANQNVGVFAGSWAWGQDALFLQTNDGANNIVLGKDQIANLPLGQSTLYMDRSTDVQITDGTSEGGRIRGKYRATNVTVQVVD